jgi:hypothetical protein
MVMMIRLNQIHQSHTNIDYQQQPFHDLNVHLSIDDVICHIPADI